MFFLKYLVFITFYNANKLNKFQRSIFKTIIPTVTDAQMPVTVRASATSTCHDRCLC